MEAAAWLLAGIVAGLADYGLGLGFGLAASLVLVVVSGQDPRVVAAAAAAAQLLTTPPALIVHGRAGNIARRVLDGSKKIIVVVSVSSTLAALAAAALAARLTGSQAQLAYALGLATLIPPLLLLASHSGAASRPVMAGKAAVVAAVLGVLAGFNKAVLGGGYSILMVAAQQAAGTDLRSAIALAPVAKLAPFIAVAVSYAHTRYMDIVNTLTLAAGALASLPVAARLLHHFKQERITLLLAATLTASLIAQVLRAAIHY